MTLSRSEFKNAGCKKRFKVAASAYPGFELDERTAAALKPTSHSGSIGTTEVVPFPIPPPEVLVLSYTRD